jgi:hypothetical protein
MADSNVSAELMRRLAEQMSGGEIPTDIPTMRRTMLEMMPLLNADPPALGAIHDSVSIGAAADVTADVFVPDRTGPHPVLVYLHGGGWDRGQREDAPQAGDALRRGRLPGRERRLSARARSAVPGPRSTIASLPCVGRRSTPRATAATRAGSRSAAIRRARTSRRRVAAHLAEEPDAPKIRAALLIYGAFDFERFLDTFAPASAPPDTVAIARKLALAITEALPGRRSGAGAAPRSARLAGARRREASAFVPRGGHGRSAVRPSAGAGARSSRAPACRTRT